MNNSVNYENQILNAIETIVNNAIENANYDKTIKAQIIERTNSNIGEYKVKYQDTTFFAYSSNIETQYPKNSLVYVLIPNNDMRQIKTIIGAVEKDNVDYVEVLETEDYYNTVGTNTCNSSNEYGLCSYNNDTSIILYDRDNNINLINFDELSLQLYLKNLENIMCGAYFRTNLDSVQKRQGNYGISFDIDFLDNTDKTTIITRNYTIDVNNMEGNPYNFINYIKQSTIFHIDEVNYQSVKKISVFAKGFPNTAEGHNNDIFIKIPILYAVKEIPEAELNGYSVKLETNKMYFNNEDQEDTTITIDSIVKIRNKIVSPEKEVQYYWFKENANIYPTMEGFNSYGGAGWECLNQYNILDSNINEIEYITNQTQLQVAKQDCNTLDNIYKLIVVFNGLSNVEATITIKNYDADYALSIQSDQGNEFYYGNGNPTLTLLINNLDNFYDFTYQWAVVDENNLYTTLEETTNENNTYNTALNNYNTLLESIEAETVLPAAAAEQLEEYKEILASFDTIQRVEGNKIYKVQTNEINDYKIYKCSVYDGDNLIGTTSIKIINYPKIEGEYFLNIINGTQTFNYNSAGIAPTSETLERPMILEPLSFTIVDNKGNLLPERILQYCNIQWTVPQENTLLIATNSTDLELSYSLVNNYDINKINNNTIQLDVQYQDLKLHAETNFSFIKDGQPGTNGTDIICKIVPYTSDENFDEYPILYYDANGHYGFNFTPISNYRWFKVQLWQNNTLLWEGVNSKKREGIIVKWSNLINNYGKDINDNDIYDLSHIRIVESSGISEEYHNYSFYFNNIDSNLAIEQYPADIIKAEVTYNNKKYYCTLPIITVKTEDWTNYKFNLIKNTGFRYAVYSSDGCFPEYENILPFTLKVTEKINGFTEDISTLTQNSHKLTYNWEPCGSDYYNNQWHEKTDLIEGIVNNNTAYYKPVEIFDGKNVTNAIMVAIIQNNIELAIMHIPIHLYLNRYGIAAINEWDGNHIEINTDKDIILSPQIGAGIKNNDNSFTGVFMGELLESGKENPEYGLYGYYEGDRTIELNATDGSAKFGKAGAGQIVLDPTDNTAVLKSGNYIAPILDSDGNIVTPGQGLEIDLTDPHIIFGSGKFRVDNDGSVHATEYTTVAEIEELKTTLVTATIVEYALGNSSETAPTTGWSQVAPAWEDGKYMWQRTTTIYSDDTETDPHRVTSDPTCIAGAAGQNAYTVFLTNENQSIAATTDGVAIATTITTNIIGYKGSTQKATIIGGSASATTFNTGITGITATITNNNTVNASVTFTITTSLTTETGSITIPIAIDGLTFNKKFTFSLSKTGSTGTGISSITEQYYLSTSKDTPTGSTWKDSYAEMGEWIPGKYVWTRSKIIYSNPTSTVYTDPQCSNEWEVVNDLQAGGRNLLRLTSKLDSYNGETDKNGGTLSTTVLYQGNYSYKVNSAWTGLYMNLQKISTRCELNIGDTVTVSQWVMFDEVPTKNVQFTLYRAKANPNLSITIKKEDIIANQWFRIKFTFVLDSTSITATNARIETDYYEQPYSFSQNMYISSPKLEKGNMVSDWTPAPEDANDSISALNIYVDNNIQNLQNQIDGAIQFWNGSAIPTLNNYPANQWYVEGDPVATENLRLAHQADVYTVITDEQGELKQGKGYRFDKVNGTWIWVEITDQEVSAVQALAASKAQVFIKDSSHLNPIPPYSVGDLWLKDGELWKCKTAKDNSGSYASGDWEVATDYTDDTTANSVQTQLNNLSIGGCNLVLNSSFESGFDHWTITGGNTYTILDTGGYLKGQACQLTITSTTAVTPRQILPLKLISGDTLIAQAKIKTTNGDLTTIKGRFASSFDLSPISRKTLTDNWTLCTFQFTAEQSYDLTNVVFGFTFGTIGTYIIDEIKLEKGNRITDWTPAPQDEIKSLDVEYALGTTTTTAPTSGWNTQAPQWEEGKYMWSRQKITYKDGTIITSNTTCIAGATGASGEGAKLLDITASAQVFKSMDGGNTFSPDTIVLTPRLQNVTYDKWYYIIGTANPVQVVSGQHGLTLNNNILTIAKTSDLFNSTSSVIFKCVATDNTIFDTITIVKLYDVAEIEIGGTNYYSISQSIEGYLQANTTDLGTMDLIRQEHTSSFIQVVPGEQWVFQNWVTPSDNTSSEFLWMAYQFYNSDRTLNGNLITHTAGASTGLPQYQYLKFTIPDNVAFVKVSARFYANGLIKLEKGTVPTDWSDCQEDLGSITYIEYNITTTSTAPTDDDSGWSPNLLESSNKKYLWQRIILQDGEGNRISVGAPTCIFIPSQILLNSELEYYIHNSKTNPPSANVVWTNVRPIWTAAQENSYLWTRTRFDYTNPIESVYSDPSYDNTWENYSTFDTSISEIVQNIGSHGEGTVQIKGGEISVYNNANMANADAKVVLNTQGIIFVNKDTNGNWTNAKTVWGYNQNNQAWEFNAQGINVLHLSADEIEDGILTLRGSDLTPLGSYNTLTELQTAHPTGSLGDAYYVLAESCIYTWSTNNNGEWIPREGGEFLLSDKNGNPVCAMDINGFTCYATDGSSVMIKTIPGQDGQTGLQLYNQFGELMGYTDTQNSIWHVSNQAIDNTLTIGNKIKIIATSYGIDFIGLSS